MHTDLKILLVEDEPGLRDVLRQCLGVYHRVITALNLASAHQLVEADDFDLVLLDKTLPDGCGFELIPFIKSRNRAATVIVMTGDEDHHSIKNALHAGADDYVIKSEYLVSNLLVRFPVALQLAQDRASWRRAALRPDLKLPESSEDLTHANYQSFLEGAEKIYLETALSLLSGDADRVAESLSLSRSTVFRKLSELDIPRRGWSRRSLGVVDRMERL